MIRFLLSLGFSFIFFMLRKFYFWVFTGLFTFIIFVFIFRNFVFLDSLYLREVFYLDVLSFSLIVLSF